MTEKLQIYRCEICGNIVEILHPGKGELVCCGQPMALLNEKSRDEGKEKHVPVVEKSEGEIKVKVGSIPHPMEEKHYIEWIEIASGDKIFRKFLSSCDLPEESFGKISGDIVAREYCSVHGLWKG
ncbi:MAG: desulfoferrodoxin [Elusimicrobia bacterium]|nr:desulfoferrodoxin [Elusimicrobiota bacterium]